MSTFFARRTAANRNPRGKLRGFSLLELMFVVAIIAILSAIAIPIYNEQARKAKRAQARGDILTMVQALERFHTANSTYNGYPLTAINSPATGQAFYTITPSGLTGVAYTITAAPVTGTDQEKDKCGSLGINQAGVKTSTLLTPAQCW